MTKKNQNKRVTFQYYAPEARQVYLAGSFNEWDSGARALKQQQDGNWKAIMYLKPGVYEYRFIVDGKWQNDPLCSELCGNGFGGKNNILRV